MDYTIITIHGTQTSLQKLQNKLTDEGCKTFHYRGVFEIPMWVNMAPEEEVDLVPNLTAAQRMKLEKEIRSISLNLTFRTWILTVMEKCCDILQDPWVARRRPAFDINHTIFNTKACDLYNELDRLICIRRKSIDEIFTEEIALVINYFLCRQLDALTGFRCRNDWYKQVGNEVITGTVIETDFRYNDRDSNVSYIVQTLGGTPWPFFKTLSTHYPDMRFTVSDVDTSKSIIQMKIYSAGRIVTTMTTEETAVIKHLDLHTSQAFGGVYFYLPLTS